MDETEFIGKIKLYDHIIVYGAGMVGSLSAISFCSSGIVAMITSADSLYGSSSSIPKTG